MRDSAACQAASRLSGARVSRAACIIRYHPSMEREIAGSLDVAESRGLFTRAHAHYFRAAVIGMLIELTAVAVRESPHLPDVAGTL